MSRAGEPTPLMMGRSGLPEGQFWTNPCPRCDLMTQGGLDGLHAHLACVHPEEADMT